MSPEILIVIISAVANGLGWLFSRMYYQRRYKAELEESKAKTESLEAAATMSTVQAADVVARSTTAILQPLLDRIAEMQKELLLIKREKEDLALKVATLDAKVIALSEENKLLKLGLEGKNVY